LAIEHHQVRPSRDVRKEALGQQIRGRRIGRTVVNAMRRWPGTINRLEKAHKEALDEHAVLMRRHRVV
jgi:hypothetical protein